MEGIAKNAVFATYIACFYGRSITSMKQQLSTYLIILVLATFPLAIWLERTQPKLWQQRLFLPDFTHEGNLHTPVYAEGTFLPPSITEDVVFTSDQNPIIVARTVTIAPQAHITFEPGTHIYVHEYGRLDIAGTLTSRGTETSPVRFTTNEDNIINRTWSGISFSPESNGTINHTNIQHASPGITCEPRAQVKITDTIIEHGNLGFYTQSPNCQISDSEIRYTTNGIISIGAKPSIQNITIKAKRNDIQTFEQ